MKNKQQKYCDCFDEVDRMVNEGLSNGTIIPKYNEAHLKLKEKEESLLRGSEEQRGEQK